MSEKKNPPSLILNINQDEMQASAFQYHKGSKYLFQTNAVLQKTSPSPSSFLNTKFRYRSPTVSNRTPHTDQRGQHQRYVHLIADSSALGEGNSYNQQRGIPLTTPLLGSRCSRIVPRPDGSSV